MPNLDAIFFPKGTPAVREKNEAATPFQGLQGHLILPIRLRICGGFCTVKFDFEEICMYKIMIADDEPIVLDSLKTFPWSDHQFSADEPLRWGNFRFPLSRRDCRFAQCAVAAPAFCCKTNLLESAVKEM